MDFGKYLRDKDAKLQQQRSNPIESHIFDGLTIYITGHTTPSAAQLMELITAHGGRVCNFYSSKNSATHIVAETLTARKSELWANYQVAKPKWIIESAAQGRLLPWTDFKTIEAPVNEVGWILAERRRVNCLDKDFMRKYFESSRLHFLSSRKRALRERLKEYQGNHTPLNGPQIIIHVDYDSFFVSAALKNRPDIADKPGCVSHGSDSSDVASCNYVARSFGVANGMWVSRARRLCPDLICLPYDFDAYTKYSDALYSTLTSIQPDYICPISIDEALINITNLVAESKQSLDSLIDHIRAEVKQKTGLVVSVGAGPNILLAKIALRMAKPNGKYVFKSEEEAMGTVASLAVDKVPGVGYVTSHKLVQMGIKKVSDAQKFTPSVLENQIGPSMTQKLYDAALGQDSNDISTLNQPAKTVGVDVAWGVRTISKEEMNLFINSLVDELWSRRESENNAGSVSIKVYRMEKDAPFISPKYMGCGKCEIYNRTVQLNPNVTRQELQDTVVQTVEKLDINPLRFRGLGVHLKCTNGSTSQTPRFDRQMRINEFKTPPQTPRKREYLTLQPKRDYVTLTQLNSRNIVDTEVFEALPEEIKQEIVQHADLHNVRLTKGSGAPSSGKKRRLKPEAEEYYPINLLGKICREPEIRAQVKHWVSISKQGPFYEDALEFYQYIESVLKDDWNWLKAVSLVKWIDFQTLEQKSCPNWRHFVNLVQKKLDGQDDETNLVSSIQACTPNGSQT